MITPSITDDLAPIVQLGLVSASSVDVQAGGMPLTRAIDTTCGELVDILSNA